MSKDMLPNVNKAYGHICGEHVQVGKRNTTVILKYCKQFFTNVEDELPDDVLAHASRLLTLVSMYSKELNQDMTAAEWLYVGLLVNTSNRRILDEFFALGQVLGKFLDAVKLDGPHVLTNSYFEMPFVGFEVAGLDPAKVNVALNSMDRVYSLVSMWCNVLSLFKSREKGAKEMKYSLCVSLSPCQYLGTLVGMFKLRSSSHRSYVDSKSMLALCECLVVSGSYVEIPSWAGASCFEGIMGYIAACFAGGGAAEHSFVRQEMVISW
jgi:hypothetical protein